MGMASETVAAYRVNAINCLEMAKASPKPKDKRVLLDMAQAWLRLCEINEKFDHVLQDDEPTTLSPLGLRRSFGGIPLNC